MTIEQLISARLSAPKTHKVITTYADGSIKEHMTSSLGAAENWATGEAGKIGRNLLDRATGETVRIVNVEVMAL